MYYWATLFNGNSKAHREPGPKAFLEIMSRVPLSQIYDYGLSSGEKVELKEIFDATINHNGEEYILRSYKNYDDEEVVPTLSLKKWYESIIGIGRKDVEKDGPNNTTINCQIDLLSPPSDLPEYYAMGLYHWDLVKAPLIEVRAYAKLDDIKIDSVEELIVREASWFFASIK